MIKIDFWRVVKVKKKIFMSTVGPIIFMAIANLLISCSSFEGKFKTLKPKQGRLEIPIKDINDGKAHYFQAKADDGIMVKFFTLKSGDGVIRAAVDACDVCYKSGKGYEQDGDVMVCTNCGRRFVSNKINEVKGGCNPAPLKRTVSGDKLIITMKDLNENSWYCQFKS